MSFVQLHKLCSYLLIVVGFLALAIPGELNPLIWVVVLISLLWSWRIEPVGESYDGYRRNWNLVTFVLFLLFFGAALVGIISSFLLLGAYAAILLQINKLFNRSALADYSHAYVLSFMMLTIGALLNDSLTYGLCFLAYVILITWSLILAHLRGQIEEAYRIQHADEGEEQVALALRSRQLIQRNFLVTTSLIALLTFAMSSALFFIFPRIGYGLFSKNSPVSRMRSGFSNEVNLGTIGTIMQSQELVMRVEFPTQKPKPGKKPKAKLDRYWRGTSYDTFTGVRWKRRFFRPRIMRYLYPNRFQRKRLRSWQQGRAIPQEIYLTRMDIPILFGIDRMQEIRFRLTTEQKLRRRFPAARLEYFSNTWLYKLKKKDLRTIRYTAFSVPRIERQPWDEDIPLRRWMRAIYTGLPKLSPRVRSLAKRMTAGSRNRREKAMMVMQVLKTQYKYSLTRKPFRGNPIENFLFAQKLGHCEFFASAMVILLRSLKVPARLVVGFRGGRWNDFGKFYAVRQSDAHAWVEVYLPSEGWVRFDPTPAVSRQQNIEVRIQQSGIQSTLTAMIEALRHRWYKWIIKYDMEHQLSALRSIRDAFKKAFKAFSFQRTRNNFTAAKRRQVQKRNLQVWMRWGLLVLFLGIVLGLGIWRWRRRKQNIVYPDYVETYLKAVSLLKPLGIEKSEEETPFEFLQRLRSSHPPLASALEEITALYLEMRFQAQGQSPTRLEALQQHFQKFETFLGEFQREQSRA